MPPITYPTKPEKTYINSKVPGGMGYNPGILVMEEILNNHLGCIKPC